MKLIFITATGTDIGKTNVTARLAKQLKAEGSNVLAVKPIITGWENGDAANDTKILLKATGMEINQANIQKCSPWRFKAPLSADMAAVLENREIDFNELLAFCRKDFAGTKLIEGAGGIMSPINKDKTFLDLARALDCEIILVTGSYLGAISHTLTALEVLKGCDVSVVISESENSPIQVEETARSISNFTKLPVKILWRGLA